MAGKIVVGVDGGGTTTRAIAADMEGRVVGYAEAGGSNPHHNPRAKENAREAIRAAIQQAEREPREVAALVAGVPGLDEPEDEGWAAQHTALPGPACPRRH